MPCGFQDDLRKDKIAVENLYAHIKALKARVERIKKEKQLSQVSRFAPPSRLPSDRLLHRSRPARTRS